MCNTIAFTDTVKGCQGGADYFGRVIRLLEKERPSEAEPDGSA
jgi:hypothetical protein